MKALDYDFIRYLSAKKKIDDGALNQKVRQKLGVQLMGLQPGSPLRILELGAGIGTMIERLVEWGLITGAEYTAVDADQRNIREAVNRLNHWALNNGFEISWRTPTTAEIQATAGQLSVKFECKDIYHFFEQAPAARPWDLGLAHAFLDLVDNAEVVPRFCNLVRPGGYIYLTLNYDGETILLPAIDIEFDERITQLYNRSMDERIINGKPAGDSKTGRHLFLHLKKAGAEILAAGSSDWIVFPGPQGYTEDETYFLQYMVHTIFTELKKQPALNQERLKSWSKRRQAQIGNAELIFIAKQNDVLARISKN